MQVGNLISGYPYLTKQGNNTWMIVLAVILVLLVVFWPVIKRKCEAFTVERPAAPDENVGIQVKAVKNAVCHPQCCKQAQWPVEHMMTGENIDLTNYVKSEYSCKSCKNGSGCLCFTKEDYEELTGTSLR